MPSSKKCKWYRGEDGIEYTYVSEDELRRMVQFEWRGAVYGFLIGSVGYWFIKWLFF